MSLVADPPRVREVHQWGEDRGSAGGVCGVVSGLGWNGSEGLCAKGRAQ